MDFNNRDVSDTIKRIQNSTIDSPSPGRYAALITAMKNIITLMTEKRAKNKHIETSIPKLQISRLKPNGLYTWFKFLSRAALRPSITMMKTLITMMSLKNNGRNGNGDRHALFTLLRFPSLDSPAKPENDPTT